MRIYEVSTNTISNGDKVIKLIFVQTLKHNKWLWTWLGPDGSCVTRIKEYDVISVTPRPGEWVKEVL